MWFKVWSTLQGFVSVFSRNFCLFPPIFFTMPSFCHYLHSNTLAVHYQDIAHRDIKPDNLLVNAAGDVLLCDFSVSEVRPAN